MKLHYSFTIIILLIIYFLFNTIIFGESINSNTNTQIEETTYTIEISGVDVSSIDWGGFVKEAIKTGGELIIDFYVGSCRHEGILTLGCAFDVITSVADFISMFSGVGAEASIAIKTAKAVKLIHLFLKLGKFKKVATFVKGSIKFVFKLGGKIAKFSAKFSPKVVSKLEAIGLITAGKTNFPKIEKILSIIGKEEKQLEILNKIESITNKVDKSKKDTILHTLESLASKFENDPQKFEKYLNLIEKYQKDIPEDLIEPDTLNRIYSRIEDIDNLVKKFKYDSEIVIKVVSVIPENKYSIEFAKNILNDKELKELFIKFIDGEKTREILFISIKELDSTLINKQILENLYKKKDIIIEFTKDKNLKNKNLEDIVKVFALEDDQDIAKKILDDNDLLEWYKTNLQEFVNELKKGKPIKQINYYKVEDILKVDNVIKSKISNIKNINKQELKSQLSFIIYKSNNKYFLRITNSKIIFTKGTVIHIVKDFNHAHRLRFIEIAKLLEKYGNKHYSQNTILSLFAAITKRTNKLDFIKNEKKVIEELYKQGMDKNKVEKLIEEIYKERSKYLVYRNDIKKTIRIYKEKIDNILKCFYDQKQVCNDIKILIKKEDGKYKMEITKLIEDLNNEDRNFYEVLVLEISDPQKNIYKVLTYYIKSLTK